MDFRDGIRIAHEGAVSFVGRICELVATPRCRSSAVYRSWLLHRAPKAHRRRYSRRLQERGHSRLRLRFQSNLARPGGFPKRRGKLIDHRLHLQHHARFSDESRPLYQQWTRTRSLWLYRLHLHLSSLGQGWREGDKENRRKVGWPCSTPPATTFS